MFALKRDGIGAQPSAQNGTGHHHDTDTESCAASPFLDAFASRLRLAVDLLRVRALSRAIAFEPRGPLRVDVVHWWHEIKEQSVIVATQRASRKRRLRPHDSTGHSPSFTNPSRPHSSLSSAAVDTAPSLTQDMEQDIIADEFVRILACLSVWTKRIEGVDEEQPPDTTDDAEFTQILDNVETAIGAVTVKLLHEWREAVDASDKDRDAVCGAAIVNMLVQFYDEVGSFHAFHPHKLCASTVQRLFRTKPRWSCSKCERSWETNGAAVPVLVFRCGACAYTICRECFTRVPNANHADELNEIRISREVYQRPLATFTLKHFVPVLMRQVQTQDPELFGRLAPKIVLAARIRLQELLLYRSQEMAPLFQLILDFFQLPGFARVFIDKEPLEWLPLYLSSAKIRLHSFLGPLMWWTSMSDEPGEINLTPEGRRDGSATALTLQWLDGYHVLREILRSLLHKLLVDGTQDVYVVEATLCYLSTLIGVFGVTRTSGGNNGDLYDGVLINLSVALVQLMTPILGSDRRRHIQSAHHESYLPRRVYLDKAEPIRRKVGDAYERQLRAEDDARIRQVDRDMKTRIQAGEHVTEKHYYPMLEKHYGVLCDHCLSADFTGLRYKCAFCDDADICGDCYLTFVKQPIPEETMLQELDEKKHEEDHNDDPAQGRPIHRADHLFLRLDVPVPLIAMPHYIPNRLKRCDLRYTDEITEATIAPMLRCAECDLDLNPLEVLYKCSNCLTPRFLCGDCLVHEERHSDPNKMHLPGHSYYGIPKDWRKVFNPCYSELIFRGLFYPSCIYPRERLHVETELFYMTMKTLHVGPLHALSKLMTTVKEIHELRAFCACEEQRVEFEKKQQSRSRAPKLSAHYSASQSRHADLSATRLMAELHLLEPTNVFEWIRFYSRACRWLLELASPDENPFATLVSKFSHAFNSFPEHFVFDLCDTLNLLTLDGLSASGSHGGVSMDFVSIWTSRHDENPYELLEPLVVMLVQLMATRKCSKNPHLRVQAAKALAVLLGFYAKNAKLTQHLRRVFKRCPLLRTASVHAVLQFHEDMEGYHLRNNGLLFNNSAGSGDHLLWGFLSIRVTTVLLLRLLWQLDDQRVVMVRVFQAKTRSPTDTLAGPVHQVSMLIHGLWSDAAKLLEEGNSKVGVLTQLQEIREALLEGRPIQLPFRPSMLEGYIALHSKHLRLSMRMLVEVVELLSWLAENTPLLKAELVDQCARTTSFLLHTVTQAYRTRALAFTWHHLEDNKRLFAHLAILVVRCASFSAQDADTSSSASMSASPTLFWRLVQECGSYMLRFLGDVDVHSRWSMNRAIVRLETARFLGEDTSDTRAVHEPEPPTEYDSTSSSSSSSIAEDLSKGEDEEQTLDEHDALAFLEHQTSVAAAVSASTQSTKGRRALSRQLGNRFVFALAKDGRFNAEAFLDGRELLSTGKDGDYEFIGLTWMTLFQDVLRRCQDVVKLQASMDELLADISDDFLDPLLNTIMTDPVRLPSGNIVDRAVIERHLLSANRVDPFTREPLTLAMLTPCDGLRKQIQLYLCSKLQHLEAQKDDVLATWGLAWDCIFELPPKNS